LLSLRIRGRRVLVLSRRIFSIVETLFRPKRSRPCARLPGRIRDARRIRQRVNGKMHFAYCALRAYAGQLITGEALRGKKPNHLLMHAWSFAVLARKLSLQALRQKRRPRWWWETRPNFPPQLAQRFSNLVMRLSSVGRLATPCCQARARTWRRIRSHRLTSTPPALCACQQRSAALAVR
jgi:hypothetical protein